LPSGCPYPLLIVDTRKITVPTPPGNGYSAARSPSGTDW
jgi:hypothetical protein